MKRRRLTDHQYVSADKRGLYKECRRCTGVNNSQLKSCAICRVETKVSNKRSYTKHLAARRKYSLARYYLNREAISAGRRAWRRKNRLSISNYNKAYYKKNRESRLIWTRAWRLRNVERVRAQQKNSRNKPHYKVKAHFEFKKWMWLKKMQSIRGFTPQERELNEKRFASRTS